jgi:A/G-specific adenine glycosylase
MAQQTQVARVDPAWVTFMQRFPTAADLAQAAPADVLREWAGLGYNRRAVQLQRAARLIVERHGGQVPADIDALEALPGIGPYTARAVAAVAFGQPVAAVDTNVRRVITRLVGEAMSERDVQATADGVLDAGDPADWTHAVMDLGAVLCQPRHPACGSCPVAAWCASTGRPDMPSGALPRASAPPFKATTRWLRGRIVSVLREAPAGSWTRLPGSIGTHGPEAVAAAVASLQRDGLLEQRPDGALRLPSDST